MAHTTRCFSLSMLAGLAASGCVWIHPTEPQRDLPSGVAEPRFEQIAVDFAHRWDHETSHHLTGAAVLDLDGDGREEIFVGGGAGQPNALLGLRDGRLVDRIQGTGLESQGATYGSCAIDLDGDSDVDLIVANDRRRHPIRERGRHLSAAVPARRPARELGAAGGRRLRHRSRRRWRPLSERLRRFPALRRGHLQRPRARQGEPAAAQRRESALHRRHDSGDGVEAEHLHLALRRSRRRSLPGSGRRTEHRAGRDPAQPARRRLRSGPARIRLRILDGRGGGRRRRGWGPGSVLHERGRFLPRLPRERRPPRRPEVHERLASAPQ